jgi:hypothetical protein
LRLCLEPGEVDAQPTGRTPEQQALLEFIQCIQGVMATLQLTRAPLRRRFVHL